jgi:hypothetical protein
VHVEERRRAVESETVDVRRPHRAAVDVDDQRQALAGLAARRKEQRAAQGVSVGAAPGDRRRLTELVSLERRVEVRGLARDARGGAHEPDVSHVPLVAGEQRDLTGRVAGVDVEDPTVRLRFL